MPQSNERIDSPFATSDTRNLYILSPKDRRKILKSLCPSCLELMFSFIEEGSISDRNLVRYICSTCFSKLITAQLIILKQTNFKSDKYIPWEGTISGTSWVTFTSGTGTT